MNTIIGALMLIILFTALFVVMAKVVGSYSDVAVLYLAVFGIVGWITFACKLLGW